MRYNNFLQELKNDGYEVSYLNQAEQMVFDIQKEPSTSLVIYLPLEEERDIQYTVTRTFKISQDLEEWMKPLLAKAKEHADIVIKAIRMENLFTENKKEEIK